MLTVFIKSINQVFFVANLAAKINWKLQLNLDIIYGHDV